MAVTSDLRFALRQLRKTPAFSMSVILTLALGIGATTGIFSLVHAVLLAPLPFPRSEQLMAITCLVQENSHSPALVPNTASYQNVFDWRRQSHTFASIATFGDDKFSLTRRDGSAEQVDGGVVSGNAFRTLQVEPILGRDFTEADEAKGNHNVLLSYQLWQRDFAGSRDVLGKQLRINREGWTIIGVMPQGLAFPLHYTEAPFWVTFGYADDGPNSVVQQRGWNDLETVVGRLRPGATQQQATAEMNAIQKGLARRYVADKLTTGIRVQRGLDAWVGNARQLRLLFAAVCCLLLIACANVAGMLLARTSARAGEMALRTALGANRWRVMRQLLVEFSLLALVGSAAGAVLAALALHLSLQSLPDLPRITHASISGNVLLFTFALAIVTTLLFGAVPAWRAANASPASVLEGGLRRNTVGPRQQRLHASLVIGEVALSLLLLVGAGLLIRSFDRLNHSDLGFRSDHLLTFRVFLPPNMAPPAGVQFHQTLLGRLQAIPGVKSVGGSFGMPFSGGNMSIAFAIDGRPTPPGEGPSARLTLASANYLRTLEIPIERGRWFTPDEDQFTSESEVTVINEAFARKFFPDADPLGRMLVSGLGNSASPDGAPHPHRRIIGVISNTRRLSRGEEIQPEYFLPYNQVPIGPFTVAVRTEGDPQQFVGTARQLVNQLAPGTPLYRVRTMNAAIERTSGDQRFQAALMTGFSCVAVLLAAVGIYGLLSYVVAQRRAEFGVRLALGAQPADVRRLVLRRGFELTLAGLVVGTVSAGAMAAWMGSRIEGLLFQTRSSDPLVFGATAAVLLIVAAVASWIPAHRASRLQPVEILRQQ